MSFDKNNSARQSTVFMGARHEHKRALLVIILIGFRTSRSILVAGCAVGYYKSRIISAMVGLLDVKFGMHL